MVKRSLVLYIASSLDGYIATEEENLDWLLQTEGEGDNGYSEFYDTVDTILIGRVTYDWIMKHEHGNFPYKGKECYVFSKSVTGENEFVRFINGDIVSFVNELKTDDRNASQGKKIWLVGGGKLLDIFMKEKLVDEIILTIAPVILGHGIPLFYQQESETDLVLHEVKRYHQFAELHYKVRNGVK